MQVKSFLLYYNERVNVGGIFVFFLLKHAQRQFNHFKMEQLITGVYNIVQ